MRLMRDNQEARRGKVPNQTEIKGHDSLSARGIMNSDFDLAQ